MYIRQQRLELGESFSGVMMCDAARGLLGELGNLDGMPIGAALTPPLKVVQLIPRRQKYVRSRRANLSTSPNKPEIPSAYYTRTVRRRRMIGAPGSTLPSDASSTYYERLGL